MISFISCWIGLKISNGIGRFLFGLKAHVIEFTRLQPKMTMSRRLQLFNTMMYCDARKRQSSGVCDLYQLLSFIHPTTTHGSTYVTYTKWFNFRTWCTHIWVHRVACTRYWPYPMTSLNRTCLHVTWVSSTELKIRVEEQKGDTHIHPSGNPWVFHLPLPSKIVHNNSVDDVNMKVGPM